MKRKKKGKKLLFFDYYHTYTLTETGLIFVYSYNMLSNNIIIKATLYRKSIYI